MGKNTTALIAVLLLVAIIASVTGTVLVLDKFFNTPVSVVEHSPPAVGNLAITVEGDEIPFAGTSESGGNLGITIS
jgi:hypothetical protein